MAYEAVEALYANPYITGTDQEDIANAQEYINILPNGLAKTNLQNILNVVKVHNAVAYANANPYLPQNVDKANLALQNFEGAGSEFLQGIMVSVNAVYDANVVLNGIWANINKLSNWDSAEYDLQKAELTNAIAGFEAAGVLPFLVEAFTNVNEETSNMATVLNLIDIAKENPTAANIQAAQAALENVTYPAAIENLSKLIAEVDSEAFLEVVSISAIEATIVEVTFTALVEDKEDVTVEVKDSTGTVREVVAQDLAKGATTAQFDFVTAVKTDDLKGVWTVNGVEFSFVELELVADIVAEASAAPVNQVKLLSLLNQAGIQNINTDYIADYATKIATETPVRFADVQKNIDDVNEANAETADEAAVVKAVVDATNQIQLLAALEANFDRVNSAWIAQYALENVGTTGVGMLALATPAHYNVTMVQIQTAIDTVNAARITAADTAADTAAKQVAVTALIQTWTKDDVAPATTKADAIKASQIKEAAFRVAEATTANALYNALVAYANITPDATLKASELNTNLRANYLTVLNGGTVRADLIANDDIKADIVTPADTAALNAALSDIDNLTAANTTAQVKAALQKLADVTSHKTGAAKFNMSTVIDSQLMNYVTLAADGFAAQTINSIALVNTAISNVNGSVNENARLDAVNEATNADEMRTALTAVAVAESTTAYINLSAQGKLEVAELVLVARDAISGGFANTAAVTTEIGTQNTARTAFIGNVNSAADTTDMIAALDVAEFPEFQALSGVDQITAAQAVEAELAALRADDVAPAVTNFTTMQQIKAAAGL